MVSQRNRILNIIEILKTFNIEVNIGKNKARGNRGFFAVSKNFYRIDIAKGLSEELVERTLVHEFAHFVHYINDNSLKSLEFIFPNNDFIMEELLKITVDLVPKDSIKPLFDLKTKVTQEINDLIAQLKQIYFKFDTNKPFNIIEDKIKGTPYKYLLKHDRVKFVNFFQTKIYTVQDFMGDQDVNLYLNLKSKQRTLKRIKSKISRMNKYYNSPTELFARSFEQFIFNPKFLQENTPNLYLLYIKAVEYDKVPEITNFIKNFKKL